MSAPRTYTLKEPIEIKNKDGEVIDKVTVLTLTKLRGEHARKLTAEAKIPLMIQMVGASAGLPPSTMDKMAFDDIMGAAEAAGDFLGSAMPAGPLP